MFDFSHIRSMRKLKSIKSDAIYFLGKRDNSNEFYEDIIAEIAKRKGLSNNQQLPMIPQDKYFLFALTMMICAFIQWSAHYIKGSPLGLDTIAIILVGVVTIILAIKK